jgi:hypothetical protein
MFVLSSCNIKAELPHEAVLKSEASWLPLTASPCYSFNITSSLHMYIENCEFAVSTNLNSDNHLK